MLPFLHSCPRLFATTPDQCSIMAGMNDEADRFCVTVAMPSGACYRDEFDEADLSKVKAELGPNLGWARFFAVVRNAFSNGAVALQQAGEASVDVVCSAEAGGARAAKFTVRHEGEDVLPDIVTALVDLYHCHTHPRAKEQQLRKMTEEIDHLIIRAKQTESEINVLKDVDVRRVELDALNARKIDEMQKEIASVRKKSSSCVSDGSVDKRTMSTGNGRKMNSPQKCRVRQPLGDKECKSYDPDLLCLIKSWLMAGTEINVNPSYNQVIKPLSAAELSNRTIVFANKQQEIVWEAMNKLDDWNYNVFEVQTAMSGDDFASLEHQPHGGSLFITMYALLIKYDFLSKFNIDEQIALNWISNVEAGYHGNPYHNSMHAADVLHITHYILSKGGMAKRCQLSDIQIFAALFAASIHDYNHPGVNNNFHIKTQSYTAILYNDRSVLENVHLSSVFELMKNPRFNILGSFTEDQRREIRETVVEMVLATDMGLHGKYIAQFRRRLGEHASFTDREDQILALAMALKMADISNCGRPLDIYLRWSSKISDEFYLQGDRERNLGMACSPFMDRLEPALAKGQISFMNYIIIPFFEMMEGLLPNMAIAVQCAEACKSYWMQSGQE